MEASVESSDSERRRRYGLLAATIVMLVAIAPQLYLCFLRGNQWNGGYAQTHGDESVYAAYLNALMKAAAAGNHIPDATILRSARRGILLVG